MDSVTQLRRLGLFDARVPRYTSYPPANHFSDDVGPEQMAVWISDIPESAEISLYIHVPFCRRLCWFCACRTQGTSSGAPVRSYVETLLTEIRIVAAKLPAGVSLAHLHWGGGTPTLLEPDLIGTLAAVISEVLPFAPGAEFSVEIDPNEIDGPRLDALVAAGMNRASIGVQDFDEEIQQTIGRPQTFEITKEAVDGIRARGIESLNVDILYGLPHQTRTRISESVQRVLSLNPDRVALYGYAHVPWMARRQTMIPPETLPAPEQRLGLFETASQLFEWDGYQAIGIDHFARSHDKLASAASTGRLRRNFQGYTDDTSDVLLALGASAISQFPEGFAQNAPATSAYKKAIESGDLATTRGHIKSMEDGIRGAMIEALMCGFGIDGQALSERLEISWDELAKRLNGIEDAFPGMVQMSPDGAQITEDGKPLARMIARFLDAYAGTGEAHSAAI